MGEHFCILFLFRRYHLQIVLYMKLSVLKSIFGYIHLLTSPKVQSFPLLGRIRDFHPLETCAARRTIIMTTSSAGGFLCGYKPVVLAGSKEPLKIRHAHSYHRQALKGFSLCLVYWLTRKRVYVLFQ